MKPCVRCGRPPHEDGIYRDCPHYVEPAPGWMRALTRLVTRRRR